METIEQLKIKIEGLVREFNPAADLSPGSVLSELVTKSTAAAQHGLHQEYETINQGATVSAALAAEGDTYNPVIDQIASNFNTVRSQGRKATGKLKVVVNANKTYYFASGLTFNQPALGLQVATTTQLRADSTGTAPVTVKQEGSQFYVILPVEAVVASEQSNVSNGTRFDLVNTSSLPEFVSASAYGNFSAGQRVESDKELIARFKTGLTSKHLLSKQSVESAMKELVPTFKEAALMGLGDPEITRNRHNIFGIAMPGVVDCYVRSATTVATTKLVKTGTKIVGGEYNGKWEINFTADDAPGFYRVISVVVSKGDFLGSQQFVAELYSYDPRSGIVHPNDIISAAEARFSRYQTCRLIFDYTSSASTAEFDVTVEHMPELALIQDQFQSGANRIPGCDYLVKAVVPCFVSVALRLERFSVSQTVDTAAIKQDIFNYINGLALGETVSASHLVNICHKYNVKQVQLPLLLTGRVLKPTTTGTKFLSIRGTDKLEIPNLPAQGISPNNTAFFIEYFDSNGKESINVQLV